MSSIDETFRQAPGKYPDVPRAEARHPVSYRQPEIMAITSFSGDLRFLSNFHHCPEGVEGPEDHLIYATSEHAFQAAKSNDLRDRMSIQGLPGPGTAKRAGQLLTLREDWEDVKRRLMLEIVLSKFWRDEDLARRLCATGTRELVEGNSWGDTEWGMVARDGAWHGRNILGRILMAVRMVIA